MAVADQPSGLMDIVNTLSQDEIPFKLRCAICNKLAVNAFRLPCCDQAICENCQTSLPETCPVCAHTPISSDLCKPNKALRTTLKAFLRTEEKKREKEREQATPTTTVGSTPADTAAKRETPQPTDTPQENHVEEKASGLISDSLPIQPSVEQPAEATAENALGERPVALVESQAQSEEVENDTSVLENADTAAHNDRDAVDETSVKQEEFQQAMAQPPASGQMPPNPMGMNMVGGFGNMGWNPGGGFNPMSQFMANGMLNFQNAMGMPGMTMDPMAQGMFGGYGMNMSGMSNGMNMGMGFDAGQEMYGDWDGSQNNMWNGGQDKFNPNAFANGMGQQYGGPSGFGGFNMSQPQQFPNHNIQDGYYGAGYTRGNFRGRGRGFLHGRGRGGFTGQPHGNFAPDANNPAFQDQGNFSQQMQSQSQEGPPAGPGGETKRGDELGSGGQQDGDKRPGEETAVDTKPDEVSGEAKPGDGPSADAPEKQSQLRGIPTIDSLDQANPTGFAPTGPAGMAGHMGMSFGRGGYMRGGFAGGRGGLGPYMSGSNMPTGPGVEGAPAAPRAMRQGLPNTSVLRHRGYQPQAQGPIPAGKPTGTSQAATPGSQDPAPPRSGSRSKSRSKSRDKSASRTRSRSRTHSRADSSRRHRRYRSRSYDPSDDDRERRRERRRRARREKYDDQSADEYDRRSRSPSIESSRRSSRRRDKERDRRSGRRSHRSRRHRTRSPSCNGDTRDHDQLSAVAEEDEGSQRDAAELSSRSHRSRKDHSSRHGDDRDRDRDRETRRRERDRDRHDLHREREKKRSRRDRTETPGGDSDYASHRRSRRVKRTREDDHEKPPEQPEKDPHTLEREARNRERLLKEQQRREAINGDRSSRKRESRSERTGLRGSRRVSYKYEDEESDAARAERVESEREASRWA